jgi:hemerythrin-like domain-containing protein
VPVGLADHLEVMQDELLDHMAKEEQILFPMLRAGGSPMVRHPIMAMRREHTSHGEQLERLMALSHDATPPAGACNTWRALYSGIAQLQNDLISHIHLENNLLFPRFEPGASAAALNAAHRPAEPTIRLLPGGVAVWARLHDGPGRSYNKRLRAARPGGPQGLSGRRHAP